MLRGKLLSWNLSSIGTSTSANADEPRDAASCKIDHIVLYVECNYQALRTLLKAHYHSYVGY